MVDLNCRIYTEITNCSSSLSSSSSNCSISSSESIVPTNGNTDAILEINNTCKSLHFPCQRTTCLAHEQFFYKENPFNCCKKFAEFFADDTLLMTILTIFQTSIFLKLVSFKNSRNFLATFYINRYRCDVMGNPRWPYMALWKCK